MESTKDRLAYLQFFIELGPPLNEEAEEKETYEEAFQRLWSDIGSLTEEQFQSRLAELVRLGDEQTEVWNCCTDGTCDVCSFLDSLDEPAQVGAASLDYQGQNELLAPCACGGLCTCDFDTVPIE